MEQIWDALVKGFPFSFINIAVLALSLAIIAERFTFIFTRYKVNSGEFMAQIRKLIQAGNVDRAVKLCEAAPLPLLQVVRSGLTQMNRGEEVVIASMEEKMAEVVPDLEKRTPWLWTLANIATLIGLLGTIRGLIRSFQAVSGTGRAALSPEAKSAALAGGISEAMWNTFLGLLIAVTCMCFHLVLSTMAKKHKQDLERSVMQLENQLTLRRTGG
jgi:biopolymer transport protein ExbB/TolQ